MFRCLQRMCNFIENGVWKRLGISRSVSYYPDLSTVTMSVSALVYRLLINAVKRCFSKDVMCICKEKLSVDHILFRYLKKLFLPPDWSSEGYLHLS